MRLIDADELKKTAYPFPCAIGVEYAVTIRAIDEAPTVNTTRKGTWEITKEADTCRLIECSECNHAIAVSNNVPIDEWKESKPYCQKCGAKMIIQSSPQV